MATWQELVTRRPSFKGVEFNCKSVEHAFGRKLQDQSTSTSFSLGVSPSKKADEKEKLPAFTDQGLMPKKLVVTVEFDGDNYVEARDAFITAVETKGPGKLVLPTYGVFDNALAESGTMRFTDQRGGIESCTVTFVLQGELTAPNKASDTKGTVKTTAKAAKASGTADFSSNADSGAAALYAGVQSVFDEKVADVERFVESVFDWLSSGVVKDADTYDEVVATLNSVSDNAETIAADATEQTNAYNEVLDGIVSSFTTAESAFAALIGIASTYAGKLQVVTGAGPLAIAKAQNQIAGLIFIQNACLSNAALLLSQLSFASVEDVQLIRETFVAAVRDLQSTIGSASGFAETYRDLVQLNAAVYNDLVARTAALPVIEDREVLSATPAMHYAFKKYGDADRVTEILSRNDIKRSLFASGTLELLSR